MAEQQPPAEPARAMTAPRRDPVSQIRHLLDLSRPEIQKALPTMVSPERIVRVAITAVQMQPALLECWPLSVVGCVLQAAQLGLDIDSSLGHAYLVPFRNKDAKRTDAKLIVGYRGLLYLGARSGSVSSVDSRVVYPDEGFEYEFGSRARIVHKPVLRKRPPMKEADTIVAAYCVVRLKDGGRPIMDVMSKAEIDAIRARSKASDSGPWVTDYQAMAQKTVARRTLKWTPMSADAGSLLLQQAIGVDEAHEIGKADATAVARAFLPPGVTDEGGSTSQGDKLNEILGD